MYECWTDRARKVIQLANQEAHRLYHPSVGSEHILLGLIKEGQGVAASALKQLDLDLATIREEVEKIAPPATKTATIGKLIQTPRAKEVLEYANEEARNLNHDYVGTEHLLLALLREPDGVTSQVLTSLGLKPEDIREIVSDFLVWGELKRQPVGLRSQLDLLKVRTCLLARRIKHLEKENREIVVITVGMLGAVAGAFLGASFGGIEETAIGAGLGLILFFVSALFVRPINWQRSFKKNKIE